MDIKVQKKKFRIAGKLLIAGIIIFIFMNLIAAFHAYTFTHFDEKATVKNHKVFRFSIAERISAMIFGVDNPRPANTTKPAMPYQVVTLQSNKQLEAWWIPAKAAKGTVLLFHGYGGEKSMMLDKATEFLNMGYNTFLVDFMGAGNSEGNQTTIGYKEGEDVKTAYDYLQNKGEKDIIMFGTSMGAVAILKAINDYHLQPQGIIIQSPFGSLHQTVSARFQLIHVPSFPMVDLLLFWGSVENGFWAFGHRPVDYARQVTCPTLLMYGEQDIKVSRKEIDAIFANLPKSKTLKIFPTGGHENLLKYKADWQSSVTTFLNRYDTNPTVVKAKEAL